MQTIQSDKWYVIMFVFPNLYKRSIIILKFGLFTRLVGCGVNILYNADFLKCQ